MPLLRFHDVKMFQKVYTGQGPVYFQDVGYCYHVTIGNQTGKLVEFGTLPKTQEAVDCLAVAHATEMTF